MTKTGAYKDHYGVDWTSDGTITTEKVIAILLQEIRDIQRETLTLLKATLGCYNFQQIPQTLKRLDQRLAKLEGLELRPKLKRPPSTSN